MPYPLAAIQAGVRANGAGAGSGAAGITLPQNLINAAGELQEGFESAADWSAGTAADNTTQTTQGVQSVQFTAQPSDKAVSWDLSGKLGCVQFDLYNHDSAAAIFNPYIGTANFAQFWNLGSGYSAIPGWQRVRLTSDAWTKAEGLSYTGANTAVIRVREYATNGMSLDNFLVGMDTIAAILMTFDDVDQTIYTIAFPYMAAAGIKATVFPITGQTGQADYYASGYHCTWEQLGAMYAAGWDIANHTRDHINLTTLSQGEAEAELSNGRADLEAQGFTRASRHVAYPNGASNAAVEAAMTATGMLTGTLAVGSSYIGTTMPIDGTIERNYALKRYFPNANDRVSAVRVVQRGEIIILGFHDVPNQSDFEGLIDQIAAAGLPCLTISQLFALESGPITY